MFKRGDRVHRPFAGLPELRELVGTVTDVEDIGPGSGIRTIKQFVWVQWGPEAVALHDDTMLRHAKES